MAFLVPFSGVAGPRFESILSGKHLKTSGKDRIAMLPPDLAIAGARLSIRSFRGTWPSCLNNIFKPSRKHCWFSAGRGTV
ncbi:hypothetical protein BLX87_05350 [Bacillus sp. VT-16-64]|nr:hypothetical protein BLX87_05350 [Bacillus sp. VT-16-64]